MSSENPYTTPNSTPHDGPSGGGTSNVSAAIVESLRGTRPWVTFLSILGFVGAGLLALMGLFMMTMGATLGRMNATGAVWLGLFYVVFSAVYVYPSLTLFRYGRAIGSLLSSGAQADLESAIGLQRSFWKFVGMVTALGIVLYVVAIVVFLVFFAASFGSGRNFGAPG
jgi:hypothetical protein